MWIGACTSSIGTWMQIVAQGWLIYRLSHSAFLLALDQFLSGIPIFLFSLVGGVIADRHVAIPIEAMRFGRIEIAQQTHQRGEYAARFTPVNIVERL